MSDKSVFVPTKARKPDWYDEYRGLRERGVTVTRICRDLGVPRSTLYAKVKEYEGSLRAA